ncbi:unnamed protein product, partial [Diplocarpon coronariae]
MPPKQSTLG